MKFRTQYSKPSKVSLSCPEPSKAQQAFKDECDINQMLAKFKLTGQVAGPVRIPQYADYSDAVDFRTSMEVLRQASESFQSLSLDVRRRFGNDPQQFLEFCNDPKNVDDMIKLGLAVKRPEPPSPAKPAVGGEPGAAGGAKPPGDAA